ncbi:MAG TPA: glycosyltransferase family 2 protein [Candidatus Thermoplasmatota archaeon]|nr:glycosyltransferase family 2 protein [Candidatus Thermoplasmatota archaeon]
MKSIVGYFVDPTISFVQTPQDYRNIGESFLTKQYKRAEAYFYHAIMPSRNEQNSIIFCGTMGILRRKALEDVGGFAEDQVCEDADISVRLACKGWNSLYVDKTFGRGLMPAVFDAYRKQFHRWAFGNVRIFLARAPMVIRSRMSLRRKIDYLVSNLHWFDGFFVTAIAAALLYLGLGPVLGYDAVTHHQEEIALLGLVPIFLLVDSIVRLHMVLGRASRLRFRETLQVQGMWFAIKFTNTKAVAKCLLGFKTPFVRTPKDPGGRLGRFRATVRAFRNAKMETLIGLTLLGVAAINLHPAYRQLPGYGAYFLPAWMSLYGLFFLCSPIYAYLSYRTLTPQSFPLAPRVLNLEKPAVMEVVETPAPAPPATGGAPAAAAAAPAAPGPPAAAPAATAPPVAATVPAASA